MRRKVRYGTFKVILVRVLVLALFGIPFSCSSETADNKNVITLGIIAPFSGQDRIWGQEIQICVDYTIQEINRNGGVIGSQLSYSSVDSASDPELALQGLMQLHQQGISVVIGPPLSSSVVSVHEYASENKIVLISNTATSPVISDYDEYVWRVAPSDAYQGRVVANMAMENSWDTAAIIYRDNAYGQGLSQAFQQAYESLGGSITSIQHYSDTLGGDVENFDFSLLVEELVAQEPLFIYLVTHELDGAQITSELYQYLTETYKPQLFGCDANYGQNMLTNGHSEVLEGMMFVNLGWDASEPNYKAFSDGFQEYLNGVTIDSPLQYVYDAVYLAAYAMERGGDSSGTTVAQFLPLVSSGGGEVINVGEWSKGTDVLKAGGEIDYNGASGDLTFDENGDVTSALYRIERIADGEFQLVELVEM